MNKTKLKIEDFEVELQVGAEVLIRFDRSNAHYTKKHLQCDEGTINLFIGRVHSVYNTYNKDLVMDSVIQNGRQVMRVLYTAGYITEIKKGDVIETDQLKKKFEDYLN